MPLTRPSLNQINTTVTALNDPLTVLNKDGTTANQDVGLVFNRDGGSSANIAVIWDETNDQFTVAFTSNNGATNANISITGYPEIVTGNLIPGGNLTYYLGSVDNQWHSLYVGPGSLYVNGQKVLQEDSGTIVFSADENQNISIQTAGSGDIEFNPGGSIELKGNVVLAAGKTLSQAGGAASEFSAGVKADSVTARTTNTSLTLSGNGTGVVNVNDSLTVANDVTVTGNLTVNGATTTVSSTNTTIEDALLLLADGQSGSPTKDAGFVVERGSSTNVAWLWDESADEFVAITTSDDATTVGDVSVTNYANVHASYFLGDGSQLTGLPETYGNTEVLAYLTDNSYATQTYVNTANTNMGGYVDNAVSTANVNLKGYVDNELTSYATSSDLTTANTNVVGYVDGEITTVNSTITTANTNVVGYVDGAVSTANVNLKGYTDATFETQSSATTANTNMKGYVDAVANLSSYSNSNVTAYLTTNSYATETYVDTANTNVVGYVDSAVSTANVNLKGYVDNEISTANVNLKGYADATFLTSFTETNDLTSAVTWANIPDANVPQSAVTQHQSALTITESQISDLGTYATASDLTTANTNVVGYVDGEITTVNSTITTANINVVGYVDNAVSTANVNLKGYVDAGNTNVVGYVDNAVTTANTNLKGYTDGQLASYATTSALTTANTNMQGYVDNEISSLIDSAPGTLDTLNEIAAALGDDPNLATTLTNTITTANTNMKGYVDGEITTVNSTITTANTNVGGYVDNAVSTANVNLKGYSDATFQTQSAATTANTNVVGYVDSAVTTANTNLKGYTDGQLASYATTSSLTTANTNMGGYVDNAVSTANVNLKGYADATFAQQTLTADLDGADTYGIINLVDPTSAQDAVTLAYLESALSSDVTNIISDDTSVTVTDDGVDPGYIELAVDGTTRANITSAGLTVTGNVESSSGYLLGDGSQITNLPDAGNAFVTISVSGQSDLVADSSSDTLTFVAGDGVVITTNASTDTLTIATSGSGTSGFLNDSDFGDFTLASSSEDLGLVTESVDTSIDLGELVTSGLLYPSQLILPSYATASLPNAAVAAQLAYDTDTGTVKYTSGSTWTAFGGIADVVEDTTPQLGGDLDLNSSDITGTGNINITGNVTISGTSNPTLIINNTDSAQGTYPGIQFDTSANQGVKLYYSEFDSELPVAGYGLVLDASPNNTQFPSTGKISLSVLGNIYTNGTALNSLYKVAVIGDSSQTGHVYATDATFTGTMTAGTIVETSTIRIKENVEPIIGGLDAILNLTGVTYDRLDNKKHEAGLIAEQVNEILPDLVAKDSEGNPSAIQYTKLTAYLIEAVKSLKAEIDELKRKL